MAIESHVYIRWVKGKQVHKNNGASVRTFKHSIRIRIAIQWTDRPMDQWTDGPMDRWTDGPTDSLMDRWMDGQSLESSWKSATTTDIYVVLICTNEVQMTH